MKRTGVKKIANLSRRVRFDEEEIRLPWLPMLLDAYAIADTGIAIAVRNVEKKQKKKLACRRGCGNCCAHQKDLPLYPHELVGIYWFAREKMEPAAREVLKKQLVSHTDKSPCPFLIDNSCAIHPLRPLGCRQFNVFTRSCAPGEDPFYTRRGDVLEPIQEYTDRAFAGVLPFYKLKRDQVTPAAIRIIRSQIMNLHSFDWSGLIAVLDQNGSANAAFQNPA